MCRRAFQINETKELNQLNAMLKASFDPVELECIMLSKISQRKTNIILFQSYVEFKKKKQMNKGKRRKNKTKTEREANHKTLNTENQLRVARGAVGGAIK